MSVCMWKTPDDWAVMATEWSKRGATGPAMGCTIQHVRSKADWVLVNGKWVPRQGVMRRG
jgi:hypothetical protein